MNIYSQLFVFSFSILLFTSCSKDPSIDIQLFDIQGHRGCRGLYPENSIPGFIHAVDLGVTTLEMDVVISKDMQVIVSHDPFISGTICTDTSGNEIPTEDQTTYNIYDMPYDTIQLFDCGSKVHPDFPDQKKIPVYKPLLSEVIATVEEHINANNLSDVFYNIEVKSISFGDNVYHPEPEVFVSLLLDIIQEKNVSNRVIIQSFDVRALQEVKSQAPDIKTALLVYNAKSIQQNINDLGYTPDIYSPHYGLIDSLSVKQLHDMNMSVIPWTINDTTAMQQYIDYGVDGMITDYPDRLIRVVHQ